MTSRRFASIALLLAMALLRPERAQACGGCFSPPETVTSVESHRMVVSLSTFETTLWDQIRYSGNPADFVWVLPVPDGATSAVNVADPAFFAELEALTSPILQPPPLPGPSGCDPPPSNCGFGAGAGANDGAPSADGPGVNVFQESTVGPYETVTIGSEDATALRTWLTDHGYNVPAETLPTLDSYIQAGSDFVVLRLAPEESVDAMTPVRVSYPGYMATFPLKMVTVGAESELEMTLWVIADQRFAAANYGTFTIDDAELVWDYARSTSNYQELFAQKIDAHAGRGWIAEYAGSLSGVWLSSAAELEIATQGLSYPFVTRLRTRMRTPNLTDDLELARADSTAPIPQYRYLWRSINAPPPASCPDYSFCAGDDDSWWPWTPVADHGAGCGCRVDGRAGLAGLGGTALATGLLLALRRRGRAS